MEAFFLSFSVAENTRYVRKQNPTNYGELRECSAQQQLAIKIQGMNQTDTGSTLESTGYPESYGC